MMTNYKEIKSLSWRMNTYLFHRSFHATKSFHSQPNIQVDFFFITYKSFNIKFKLLAALIVAWLFW